MKADYIKEIIKTYEKSPYECILINGPWGVGKSYAIKEAFDNNNITKTCSISMFGLQDAQAIYHEVLFDLVFKDKTLHKLLSRATNAFSEISNKFAITKKVVTSFVKEKELFLNLSENFNQYHFVVIDDLERMNESIELEEVFGIIDELKRCNYVKVILVANLEEISKNILFDKYSEKVIDRIYHITERPEKVDWAKLGIHHGFITEFLSKHPVKNLRTLQKAQNLYDDVRLKLKDGYRDDFYNEIRLACYAIVVESIDNLYYRNPEQNQKDSTMKVLHESFNRLETRIIRYYLQGIRISNTMVDMLQKYYENEIALSADEIDAEYQLFIHAGEKANYYKSDAELKQVLPNLAEKIKQETNIGKILKYADEYFIWSEHLELDTGQLTSDYKVRLHDLIYTKVMSGNMEYLTYGIDSFHIQSQTNISIVKEINESVKTKAIREYVDE